MKKRQIIILSAVLLLILAIAVAIVSRKKEGEVKADNLKNTAKYVRVEEVKNGNYPLIVRGHGRVGSSRNVTLNAEVQGKLMMGQVTLKGGTQFRQGQLLFSIDDREASLKMQARKSGFLTMLASSLPDLKVDHPETFKTWETFFEKIDVAEQLPELPELKSVKEKTYMATRNILGEYYSIKADERTLEKFKIVAPFNGSFVEVFTEMGTVVNPGTPIARIIQESNLEVSVSVSAVEVNFLKIGQTVTLSLSGSDISIMGKILRIGHYINPNTQSVDVFVGVDEGSGATLYDGMYAEAVIDCGEINDVYKIPRKALLNNNAVFLVNDSILTRTEAIVKARDKDFIFVSGLKNGSSIVVEALANPVDGMIVKTIIGDE